MLKNVPTAARVQVKAPESQKGVMYKNQQLARSGKVR